MPPACDTKCECRKQVAANLVALGKYSAEQDITQAYNSKVAIYTPLKHAFDKAVMAETAALTAFAEFTECTFAGIGTHNCENLHGTTDIYRETTFPQNINTGYDCGFGQQHTQCMYSDSGIATLLTQFKSGVRNGIDGTACPKEPTPLQPKPAIYELKLGAVVCCNQSFDGNKYGAHDVINYKNISQDCKQSLDNEPPDTPVANDHDDAHLDCSCRKYRPASMRS